METRLNIKRPLSTFRLKPTYEEWKLIFREF